MQRKRLAIISTHPIQYNAPLFRLLAKRKVVNVKVFYTWSQSQETVEDKEFGIQIKWDIPLLEGYDYEFIPNISTKPKQKFGGLVNPGLIPAIERWEPDAVLVFGWNFSSHFKSMRHFHGRVPVWFRGDSTLIDERPGIKLILRRLVLRYVYSFVDKAFYVGQNNKDYFKAHGLKGSQLVFAPHAIDNTRFGDEAAKTIGREWRNELGFCDDEIVMVFAGKIYWVKNIVSFATQFAQYVDDNPKTKLRLLIVGNGELENYLPENKFIFRLPFQNQSRMPALNNVGDIYILPSLSETWGLAVNEAMAAGKPVIVTEKVGSAIDLVRDGVNGFYFSLENPCDNNNMFKRLESENLVEMGNRNRNFISSWSHQVIAEAIESTIVSTSK